MLTITTCAKAGLRWRKAAGDQGRRSRLLEIAQSATISDKGGKTAFWEHEFPQSFFMKESFDETLFQPWRLFAVAAYRVA
jgi:hypothetical protein